MHSSDYIKLIQRCKTLNKISYQIFHMSSQQEFYVLTRLGSPNWIKDRTVTISGLLPLLESFISEDIYSTTFFNPFSIFRKFGFSKTPRAIPISELF